MKRDEVGSTTVHPFRHLLLAEDREPPPCTRTPNHDIFYPRPTDTETAELAKRICQRCRIVTECLQWALDTHEPHAILGGMTPLERQAFKRKQRRLKAA